jgi:hypothetical protein
MTYDQKARRPLKRFVPDRNHTLALCRSLIPEIRYEDREPTEQEILDIEIWQSFRIGRARREATAELRALIAQAPGEGEA